MGASNFTNKDETFKYFNETLDETLKEHVIMLSEKDSDDENILRMSSHFGKKYN